jgi:transcriptional regulator with XRE-family HTH domain
MKSSELNILMGRNLQKLRIASKLSQEQLGERLQVSSGLIPKWEAGTKGIGKNLLLKICRVLKVRPCLFFVEEKCPIISNSRESDFLFKLREAEKHGVDDMIEEFSVFIVDQARKKRSTGLFMARSRVLTVSKGN